MYGNDTQEQILHTVDAVYKTINYLRAARFDKMYRYDQLRHNVTTNNVRNDVQRTWL